MCTTWMLVMLQSLMCAKQWLTSNFPPPPPLMIMSALCFLLPLVEKLSHLHSSKPAVLVLGPVRELCIQTESVAKKLMQGEVDCRMNQLVSPVPSVGCPL